MAVSNYLKIASGFGATTLGISMAIGGSALARESAKRAVTDEKVDKLMEAGKIWTGVTIASVGVILAANGIKQMDRAPFCSFLSRLPWLV